MVEDGSLDQELDHRIQSEYWRMAKRILCDRKVSTRAKGKLYMAVVRSALLYGVETWPLKRAHERKLEAVEMRMYGVMREDRMKNDRIRGRVGGSSCSRESPGEKTAVVQLC